MAEFLELSQLDPAPINGIFFDIDDTFTSEGKITAEAYSSLWQLKESGLLVVPITGRPAGWCDHIARMWPVSSVVGENGAFYFLMKNGKLEKHYVGNPIERRNNRDRMLKVQEEILNKHPRAALASDQHYREFDLAIDFCEDVPPLSRQEIMDIYEIFKRHGAKAKISSIHVNGWFGSYDKLSGITFYVKNELNQVLAEHNREFVYCGDSPNDESLFHFFKNSVGVANVHDFQDIMTDWPRYVTKNRSGEGFAELVRHILNHRQRMQ